MNEKKEKLREFFRKTNYIELPEIFMSGGADDPAQRMTKMSRKQKKRREIAALKRFQTFSGLKATGRINKATLAQIEKPGCGFPDVTADDLMASDPSGNRWSTKDISFCLLESAADLPRNRVEETIRDAFNIWATTVFPFNFREVLIDDGPMIIIRFVTGNHLDPIPFKGVDGDLAHAFPPIFPILGLGGDIHFDDAENWGIPEQPATYDLLTVALHEIGHSLGLPHSPNKSSIMFKDYVEIRNSIDDESALLVRNLYHDLEDL